MMDDELARQLHDRAIRGEELSLAEKAHLEDRHARPGEEEARLLAGADVRPPFSTDGVDLTLIRWMLSLTPAERLNVLQQAVRSILGLRNGKLSA
jgi:hypothetical protein